MEIVVGQTVYADGRRNRLHMLKEILARHFPGGAQGYEVDWVVRKEKRRLKDI